MAEQSKYSAFKYLAWITQLGLSVIIPIVVCTLIGNYLKNQFGFSDIIVLISIFLGLISAGINCIKFFRYAEKEAEKSKKERGRL